VSQRLVQPETGRTVPYSATERAYEIDRGLFVRLRRDELEQLEPPASRDIEITRFVDPALISHAWYDRPYYLGPDDNPSDYFALARALDAKGKEGVARWVMRKKHYVGALRSEGDYLMLITLRHAGELLSAQDMDPPAGRPIDEKERRLAERLIDALQGDFRAEEFEDEYRQRVLTLIEKKQRGEPVELPAYAEERVEIGSLEDSLEASLAMMK
jgi:DNA end-binding protein Ku